ncbi:DUF397 domain-containing protein [Actinomadura fibrosa]|uniref:DUF397 domain-containing protein n=1 Tax=Actinomadura fibrosa TaxID=111802 RepID=A0ABW2XFG1_9ACTN|nr:DUF397 domain-containing protein [Actinomadura fibrosa]
MRSTVSQLDRPVVTWRKSSHSDGTGGECVEVGVQWGCVVVRDSKNPNGPVIALTPVAARDLMNRVRGTE